MVTTLPGPKFSSIILSGILSQSPFLLGFGFIAEHRYWSVNRYVVDQGLTVPRRFVGALRKVYEVIPKLGVD